MPWWGGWGGRGYRWMFWLTGLPGWARFGYPGYYPAYTYYPTYTWPGFGWFWRCRWFPWLPRWWWTGMYGPVQWTPQGPVLASQAPTTQTQPTQTQWSFQLPSQPSKDQEIQWLREELKALEEDKKAIEQRMKEIEERLKELEKQS